LLIWEFVCEERKEERIPDWQGHRKFIFLESANGTVQKGRTESISKTTPVRIKGEAEMARLPVLVQHSKTSLHIPIIELLF